MEILTRLLRRDQQPKDPLQRLRPHLRYLEIQNTEDTPSEPERAIRRLEVTSGSEFNPSGSSTQSYLVFEDTGESVPTPDAPLGYEVVNGDLRPLDRLR